MFALTGKDPWFSLIAWSEKHIETRGFHPSPHRARTPFRLALHTSSTPEPDLRAFWLDPLFGEVLRRHGCGLYMKGRKSEITGLFPPGCIIAVCTVAAIEQISGGEPPAVMCERISSTTPRWDKWQETHFGNYQPGRWAWLLRDVRVLDKAIPETGAMGLWEYRGGGLPREE